VLTGVEDFVSTAVAMCAPAREEPELDQYNHLLAAIIPKFGVGKSISSSMIHQLMLVMIGWIEADERR